MSDRRTISGVVCLWMWVPAPKGSRKLAGEGWKFVESYAVQENGYPLTEPKCIEFWSGERDEWRGWLYKRVYARGQARNGHGWKSVKSLPGRAVTCWSIEGGVGLLGLNPPEPAAWVSEQFVSLLRKLPDWFALLQDGHTLYLRTAREAERYVFPTA